MLIINVDNKKAKEFFLSADSYFTLDLPKYFNFQPIIDEAKRELSINNFDKICNKIGNNNNDLPHNYDGVNYKLLHNKDGKYAWRQFQLINPYLYVYLVNSICETVSWNTICSRFKDFRKNKNIVCCSIPLYTTNSNSVKRTILNWWSEFEQRIISSAIDYEYMISTDITSCYDSIYTHSIPWAIHTKDVAKVKRGTSLIGNKIDWILREMSYGQTNGIPQGSKLMDFIAEIILGYADELLGTRLEELNIVEYKIVRYRDDYRIFSNNSYELDTILKELTDILSGLNFSLNSKKTFRSSDIITDSIKYDKFLRFKHRIDDQLNIQKKLFLIRDFGIQYPNCGSLSVLLSNIYHEEFENITSRPNSCDQIMSIIVDIMYRNPRVFPICISILSHIIKFYSLEKRNRICIKILNKFKNTPNTDYLEIWLQRITLPVNRSLEYSSALCKCLYDNVELWEFCWSKKMLM